MPFLALASFRQIMDLQLQDLRQNMAQKNMTLKINQSAKKIILSDGRTPDMLFSGDLPYNQNNKPYNYYWDDDTTEYGFITK